MIKTNLFAVTGFVANVTTHEFKNATVAHFSLGIARTEKKGEEFITNKAYITAEAWRKNDRVNELDCLRKGAEVTIQGFFLPNTWTDKEGKQHSNIIFAATDIELYEQEKEMTPEETADAEPPLLHTEVTKTKKEKKAK